MMKHSFILITSELETRKHLLRLTKFFLLKKKYQHNMKKKKKKIMFLVGSVGSHTILHNPMYDPTIFTIVARF